MWEVHKDVCAVRTFVEIGLTANERVWIAEVPRRIHQISCCCCTKISFGCVIRSLVERPAVVEKANAVVVAVIINAKVIGVHAVVVDAPIVGWYKEVKARATEGE